MDKGSRQISSVTLGKGMALVAGWRASVEEPERACRNDGCYPFGDDWLLSLLARAGGDAEMRSWALRGSGMQR